jgi:hypothetical protein
MSIAAWIILLSMQEDFMEKSDIRILLQIGVRFTGGKVEYTVLFRKLIRKSNGTIVLTFGCCDIICPYSNVTTSRAPASKTHASTQGVWDPITNTRPCLISGACFSPSLGMNIL